MLVTTTVSAINENNNKSDVTTKHKRTIPDFQNQAELKQLTPIYQVNHPNNQPAYQQTYHQSNEPHLNNFYENSNKYYTQPSTPIKTVFEGDSKIPAVKNIFEDTPKVAAQHVLYEYEQTPTNAVSNVQVKQLFQRPEESKTVQTEKIALPEPNRFLSAETAVNPVHHSTLVNHAQNFGHVVNHPLYNVQPTHVQHQQYIPNKYFYVNGKIVYQPGQQNQHPTANVNNHQTQVPRTNFQNYQIHPQTHHNPVHSQPYSVSNQNFVHGQSTPYLHNKQYQKIPPSNVPQQYRSPQQKLIPPPMTYVRFHPPARHQMQPITQPVATPLAAPVKEEQAEEEEEEDDKEQLREEEEDSGEANEEEESANLEEADGEAEEEEDDREYQRPEKLHGLFGKKLTYIVLIIECSLNQENIPSTKMKRGITTGIRSTKAMMRKTVMTETATGDLPNT